MSVGLVVVSFNRPEFLEKSLKAVSKHLHNVVDAMVVVNDGSDAKHAGAYKRAYRPVADIAEIIELRHNCGVASAKNIGITHLLSNPDIDHIFILEDDIIVKSPNAMLEYLNAMKQTGVHHLSFAHHGPANMNVPDGDGPVSFFPHSIGAWTSYSVECLKAVGLFDEIMVNAFEHVEHDMRLIQAGYMPGAAVHQFPDATGSANWLGEIPGSIDKSSIRPRADWSSNIRNSLTYWQREKSDTFELLFGEGTPLHAYAMSVIG